MIAVWMMHGSGLWGRMHKQGHVPCVGRWMDQARSDRRGGSRPRLLAVGGAPPREAPDPAPAAPPF
jgi:hypothetical protein